MLKRDTRPPDIVIRVCPVCGGQLSWDYGFVRHGNVIHLRIKNMPEERPNHNLFYIYEVNNESGMGAGRAPIQRGKATRVTFREL